MHVNLIANANRADDRYGSSFHTDWVKPSPLSQRPYVSFRQQRTSAPLALGSNVP